MARFALYGIVGGALLLTASTAALADPVTLICNYNASAGAQPMIFVMDEASHMVTRKDLPIWPPMPAAFDSEKITFTGYASLDGKPDGDSRSVMNFTINRLTGSLSEIWGGVPFPNVYTCEPGKAKF